MAISIPQAIAQGMSFRDWNKQYMKNGGSNQFDNEYTMAAWDRFTKEAARNQLKNEPPAYPGDSWGGGGGDGGAAARAAAEEQRQRDFIIGNIDNQIAAYERQFGDLDAQQRAGLNSLKDAYNRGLSRLNQQHSAALSKYKTQRGDNKRNFMTSADDNRASARTNYQALMQMLGRAGAGRSSAATLHPNRISRVIRWVASVHDRSWHTLAFDSGANRIYTCAFAKYVPLFTITFKHSNTST